MTAIMSAIRTSIRTRPELRPTTTGVVKLLLFASALAAGIGLPYVVGPFLLATATLALTYALFAMSINLLAGYAGLLSLGQAGIFGVAAYGVGYVATRAGGGHLAQVFWGLVAGLLVSVLFGLMAMRTSKVYFLMVTLAQGMIVFGLATSLEPITGAENGLTGVYRPGFAVEDWRFYYLCLAVLVGCAALIWVILRSPFGMAMRGLRESDSRLRMVGYNTTWHRLYGFVLSGFFSSVAGILYAYHNEFVSPSVAEFATSAQAILMIILGGVGTMSGPVVGAFIIVYVQNVLSLDVDRWPTLMGLIFIAMVLFARDGFVGGVTRLWTAWTRRAGRRAGPHERDDGPPDQTSGEVSGR
jgi:branched-chain amino acid transport system permease protein